MIGIKNKRVTFQVKDQIFIWNMVHLSLHYVCKVEFISRGYYYFQQKEFLDFIITANRY